ncbi:AAA family ATPase [Candidatus Nomurabacteria bacterium]|nr:AAA family ATPase [Candidatus Nomurabacteria bacterium]
MRLLSIELSGFKSFAKKTTLEFGSAITSVVGPNGSGKSNVAESFRFVLGEQSMKSMRGKRGEDMIWNGSGSVPRAGRAGVKLVFDNTDRALNLDFDEVAIERVVHRDGNNEYLLNGSQVRLRDISELLSRANIGASGHHIISQGEADRALSASSRERREMLEDALGLTTYLYKREEAEKKLEKTAENMREVESLRRELSPHLKFLNAQVKKIEDAHVLREELFERYTDYLSREHIYLRLARAELGEGKELEDEHTTLDHRITQLRKELEKKHDAGSDELMALEREGRETAHAREAAVRELGGIEGELRALERMQGDGPALPAREARDFAESILSLAEGSKISELISLARSFIQKLSVSSGVHSRAELLEKKQVLESQLKDLQEKEEHVAGEVSVLRKKIEGEKDASREAERELFAAMARRSELEGARMALRAREDALKLEEERFKEELREAAILLERVPDYEQETMFEDEPRSAQEERRRKLERQKIRLEEAGLGNSAEILKEHQETTERDQFLLRELADLETSAQSLRLLIEDLTATLEERFVGGVEKINAEFDAFFKLMFGGGSASLQVVKETKLRRGVSEEGSEDMDVEEGVEISVTLPHKRIKGLHMLSGGERALTSIALIFAMSQVNPPPFLILDETDAALDEANSRRYGDMIETLAKKSQLILITHNRETMSRASVLYGVTMGSDGVSKLLSVKFEEAVAVAK